MARVEVNGQGRNLYPYVLDKRTGEVYGGEQGVVFQVRGGRVEVIKKIAEVELGETVIYPGEKDTGVVLVPKTDPGRSFLSRVF